ncbi:DUF4124 domain-containing protein [Chitinibacter sp. FCG-7]|uniref:DUF4124 domain-containing protein n=1 Tax=Chitinibacter mangrovi TaxID=3153927 RepID=A0AAU7F8S9_9NEIS
MRMTTWLLLAASLGTILSAQAQVYKWVDANGRVIYSDQPPPAGVAKAKTVNVKDTAVTSVAAPKKADASAVQASAPQTASAPAPSPKPVRDEAACSQAQKRLSFLNNAKLFKERNEKGQLEFLDAERKKQEIAEKQAFIEKNCR